MRIAAFETIRMKSIIDVTGHTAGINRRAGITHWKRGRVMAKVRISEALKQIALDEGGVESPDEISLYLWQEQAIPNWVNRSEELPEKQSNDDKEFFGIVAAVTGSGKTVYALEAINVWLQMNPTGNVTILVPTRVLVNQWRRHLQRAFQQPIGQYGGGRKTWHQINVSTMDTGARGFPDVDKEPLIVVDECHNVGSPTRRYALLNNPHTAVLGLSATPEREDSGLAVVGNLCGPVVFRYGYREA